MWGLFEMNQYIIYVSDKALQLAPDRISNDIQRALENVGTIIRYNGAFYNPIDIIPYKINDKEYEAFSYDLDKKSFTLYDLKTSLDTHLVATIHDIELIDALKKFKMIVNLKEMDGIWSRYFRDGFTLSDIAKEYNCAINDLEFLVDRQTEIINAGIKSKELLKGVL